MDDLFRKMGRKAGKTYARGKWAFQSVFGSESDSIEAEKILGRELAGDVRAQFPPVENDSLQNEIVAIGNQLKDFLQNPSRDYRFSVIQSPDINAFALPGGFIFLTENLLSLEGITTHDVAFVLSHEIGHIIRGHPFDRFMADTTLKLIAKGSHTGHLVSGALQKTAIKLLQSSYSREQELEADWFGIRLMSRAGYDAKSSIHALELLDNSRDDQDEFHYFSTHPAIQKRIAEIRYRVKF